MKIKVLNSVPKLIVFASVFFQIATIAIVRADDRTLSMFNIHTKETITVTFKKGGSYVPDALKKLNHFMRDWRKDAETHMDPALIDLVWELHQELGSKEPVHLICGYRTSGTNESLRLSGGGQAKQSRHITGQAADMMFPDVPIKQLRYSALIRERGGVGFYPASGIPFVHVDTGNIRHWPRLPRMELAVLFPKGQSKHVPTDERPITKEDHRLAMTRWQSAGYEVPWALSHKTASGKTMLASVTPSSPPARLQMASLIPAKATIPDPSVPLTTAPKPESVGKAPPVQEPELSEEGDEQNDDIVFEPLPATFLLAEKPLFYSDTPEVDAKPAPSVFRKVGLLMVPESVMTSEEFEKHLQIEAFYEANRFKGPAVTLMMWHKSRSVTAALSSSTATR